ncbi:MAG: protein-L-isoaspartate O-methyltransferase family protein [Hyphomicrobium sp.]
MADVAKQRANMVENQVRPSDVTDRRILSAMQEIPRERFVPTQLVSLAYIDEDVPLSTPAPGAESRWLMAPRVLAKLLQLAEVGEEERVLDVGIGTGYSAALLGKMASSVVALENDASLAKEAATTLKGLAINNVDVVTGDLVAGCRDRAPFDVVILGGAIDVPPDALLEQLKEGGRLVAVFRQDGLGKAAIWRRLRRSFDRWIAFDAAAKPLPGFQPAPEFVL